ncbi:MAG: 50S ribosomal protein L33 [Planctomycetota bacterium]
MAKAQRDIVKLQSTASHHTYYTKKKRAHTPHRMELKKYDPVVRRHILYRESK